MKAKRILSSLLAALLLVSSLGACSGGTDGSSAVQEDEGSSSAVQSEETGYTSSTGIPISDPGEYPIVEDTYTLDVFIKQPADIGDVETNDVTKALEELTNAAARSCQSCFSTDAACRAEGEITVKERCNPAAEHLRQQRQSTQKKSPCGSGCCHLSPGCQDAFINRDKTQHVQPPAIQFAADSLCQGSQGRPAQDGTAACCGQVQQLALLPSDQERDKHDQKKKQEDLRIASHRILECLKQVSREDLLDGFQRILYKILHGDWRIIQIWLPALAAGQGSLSAGVGCAGGLRGRGSKHKECGKYQCP